jgi:redox-sensitive bicupin YhaK (pirin superfamily)
MATETSTMKGLIGLYHPGSRHMVGDGFLMLDYAGPQYFSPTDHPRGVGEHPHRGFETVTIVYEGVVAHRDSAGNAGVIGPGDVQWMTAASGIVHEEFHEKEFARKGGTLHAIQLWVNLPRTSKMSAPGYQTILNAEIPSIDLDGGAGRLRVIAGSFLGHKGPAHTVTPVELYDLQLKAGKLITLALPEGHTTAVFVLQGRASVNGSQAAGEAELIVCTRDGSHVTIDAQENSRLLVMAGEPIEEPIARYGPFVMNTRAELMQAAQDYQAGKMGHLS